MSTAKFGIKITGDAKGGVQAIGATKRELKSLRKSFDKHAKKSGAVQKSNTDLALSFSKMIGPVAGLVSATAGLNKLVGVAREFDVLNAQLITATGSAENAGIAFDAIKKFATTTPYDLQQATKAFTQLVNLGLTPSERALTSYGDTASAMGKDLGQLVEAVADAATGEFERLKEFGIKSKSEGENVSFTFKGVTKTVKKEASAIEGYLISLGENNFSGAMANRMDTLDGKISNLGDSWDSLFLTIYQQDSGGLMVGSVELAIEAIQELEAMISSGQLLGKIEALGNSFTVFGDDAAEALDIITNLLDYAFDDWGGEAETLSENLTAAFSNMPEYIRAFIQIMTTELANFVGVAKAYGSEIADNLTFWKDESFDLDGRLATLEKAKVESISYILQEKDAAIKSFDDQIKGADRLREKYDELQKSKKESIGEDNLSQFAVSKGKDAPKGGEPSGKISGIDSTLNALKQQVDFLGKTTEEQELSKLKAQGATDPQIELAKSSMRDIAAFRQQEEAQKASAARQEEINSQALAIQESHLSEEQSIKNSYKRRRDIILENTVLTSEAQRNLLLNLENEKNEQLEEINKGYWERYLESAQENLTSFDELSAGAIDSLTSGFGSALESMVFDSENFGDAMKNLMTGIARSVVGALGQMAAQWLAYKVVQAKLSKATQKGTVATMTANAKAMAVTSGINAFTSTAAKPIVGPALAPGAMAAALAVTTPAAVAVGTTASAGLASFDGGGFTGYGPRSGGLDGKGGFLAMMHKNETVIDHTKTQGNIKAFSKRVVVELEGLGDDDRLSGAQVKDLIREIVTDTDIVVDIHDATEDAKRTGYIQ